MPQRYGYLCHTDTTDSTELKIGAMGEAKIFSLYELGKRNTNCTNHTNLACTTGGSITQIPDKNMGKHKKGADNLDV